MVEVFAAFSKSLRDLTRPEVLWQALWPPLLALLLWVAVGFGLWSHGVELIGRVLPQLPWEGWEWVARWAAVFLLLAAFAVLVYVTAILLVAVFALPRLINLVAARDYPDLGRHGENVFWGSLGTTLGAGAIFVVGGLLMLPLLLIPGVLLVLPLAWGAWLNQRTFRFDALAEHATRAELQRLVRENRSRFYAAGLATAAAAHVPLLNLLAPALTALVFVHLGLTALRRQRRQGGVEL
ncbi:MAG: EI24 domain-containing protein [Sulfuritalea sp.]|nr:EI24 domain-containing protein [Sulfuritalea sp.]MDP1981232.1 EI24 domain-containing protein [Sulfuritalea sp.]